MITRPIQDTVTKMIYDFVRCISRIKDTSFINYINGITSRISWLNAIYSHYDLLKMGSISNLLHHNTLNPVHVITYPVRDMIFSAL